MATETEEKKQAEPEQTEEKPSEETQAEQKSKPEKQKKPPKERNLLLTIATILFILVGIAELGLWGYTGFGVFRGSQARRAYEAQQAALQAGAERPTGASYSGPGLTIENGEVVWRRTDDLTQNGFGSSSGSVQGSLAGSDSTETIPRALWIPYPPPPWARESTTQQSEAPQADLTQPDQEPVQT